MAFRQLAALDNTNEANAQSEYGTVWLRINGIEVPIDINVTRLRELLLLPRMGDNDDALQPFHELHEEIPTQDDDHVDE